MRYIDWAADSDSPRDFISDPSVLACSSDNLYDSVIRLFVIESDKSCLVRLAKSARPVFVRRLLRRRWFCTFKSTELLPKCRVGVGSVKLNLCVMRDECKLQTLRGARAWCVSCDAWNLAIHLCMTWNLDDDDDIIGCRCLGLERWIILLLMASLKRRVEGALCAEGGVDFWREIDKERKTKLVACGVCYSSTQTPITKHQQNGQWSRCLLTDVDLKCMVSLQSSGTYLCSNRAQHTWTNITHPLL